MPELRASCGGRQRVRSQDCQPGTSQQEPGVFLPLAPQLAAGTSAETRREAEGGRRRRGGVNPGTPQWPDSSVGSPLPARWLWGRRQGGRKLRAGTVLNAKERVAAGQP